MPSDRQPARSSWSRRDFLSACGTALAAPLGLRVPCVQANDLRLGLPAPPASLVTLDGQKIPTSGLLGKVVVLTFWATWCEPCREELPLLSRYAAYHGEAKLQVLGFSLDLPDQLAEVRKVAQTLRFPVGLLSSSSAPGYGRIWRLPVNFTIDPAGRLVEDGWKERQPSWTAERLDEVVTPLLS